MEKWKTETLPPISPGWLVGFSSTCKVVGMLWLRDDICQKQKEQIICVRIFFDDDNAGCNDNNGGMMVILMIMMTKMTKKHTIII